MFYDFRIEEKGGHPIDSPEGVAELIRNTLENIGIEASVELINVD